VTRLFEDGLYRDDPKKNPDAAFIPDIAAQELLNMDANDLILERAVLEYIQRAVHVREVQIVNGLKPGRLTRALAGEHIATNIHATMTCAASRRKMSR
jgi:molybdenum storage protein